MKKGKIAAWLFVFLAAAAGIRSEEVVLRVGHFPNITHAQALVAHHLSRSGKGWFEARLGPDVKIEWFVYNAGPTAMEAIFARSLDITYVGPNPALNAHLRSRGKEVRVLAGAANGGAALVVRSDGPITKPADFRGKKIATPQFGNTQDVSCRFWLKQQGFRITRTGGDVLVVPTANPDQISLFQRGLLDGVWTVEPWVSRLEMEAGGRIFFEEKDVLTTVLACRAKFLEDQPDLARRFVQAHIELTEWIRRHPEEAQKMATDALSALAKAEIPPALIQSAWKRLHFTSKISRESFEAFLTAAQDVGFLTGAGNLDELVVPWSEKEEQEP